MRRTTWALALAAGLAWVPIIFRPLSPDEGGFLLVASQWQPGTSLYGRYWVDRPPLLLTLFDLASHLGGAVALRLIALGGVVASVLLAAHLGRIACGRALAPALVAAIFLSTPLFGATEVDGEVLAVPLVLAGLVAAVHARSGRTRRDAAWLALAGACGMAAAMVKQNVVDVLVVAAVLVVWTGRRSGLRRTAALAGSVGSGALLVLGSTLGLAELRGTEPRGLWGAVVTFRAQAATVIDTSSTAATTHRLELLLAALVLSGAPLVIGVLLLRLRGPSPADGVPDLRVPAVALLLWEVLAVTAGGSYWLHYLVGLVPGLVLLTVAVGQRPIRLVRTTTAALALAVTSCLVAVAASSAAAPLHPDDTAVAAYLRDHGTAHDTVVVGFGHPNIVWDAGMQSPYAELWSLPVRVRDPRLTELTRVLDGPSAPTWVVVDGDSLATWGVDATSAEGALRRGYRLATTVGTYQVWRRHVASLRGRRPRGTSQVIGRLGPAL